MGIPKNFPQLRFSVSKSAHLPDWKCQQHLFHAESHKKKIQIYKIVYLLQTSSTQDAPEKRKADVRDSCFLSTLPVQAEGEKAVEGV